LAGKTELSLSELNLARYRRAATDQRVLITQYTYADICDLLFAMTNRTEYRDVALDWARKRQRVEPSQSWSFALEAKLSQDPGARRKAAAMTFYLDPNSEILSSMKKQEIEAAVKEYGKSNIFLKTPKSTDKDQST
jgi:hypothetical protein